MLIAKWPVDCVGCPRKIEPGEPMENASGVKGWVHVFCDPETERRMDAWQSAAIVAPDGWPA